MLAVNIGGGNFQHKDWLNLDYPFESMARKRDFNLIDIPHNLMDMRPIPLADKSVDVIYSEHCIEHITHEAVEYMISDCYRMLKDGGHLKISCPDANKLFDMYSNDKDKLKRTVKQDWSAEHTLVDWVATPVRRVLNTKEIRVLIEANNGMKVLDVFSDMCRFDKTQQEKKPGDHLSWWNYEKLHKAFVLVGFHKIHKCKRNDSWCEELRQPFLDKTAPDLSVRIEGEK